MKRFWSFALAVFMLVIIMMVTGGSLLAHVLCDQCQINLAEKSTDRTCECCHHETSDTQPCNCKYAFFAFESESTHLIQTDIQSKILRFLVAHESLSSSAIVSIPDAYVINLISDFSIVPPPLLSCGGRHILTKNAVLII